MNSRLPILFISAGPKHTQALLYSIETFLDANACALDQFRPILFLYRPDHSTVELVKSTLQDQIPLQYIHADAKPVCVECVFKRYGARYGFVIPSDYYSIAPIWPYLPQIRNAITNNPNLTLIRLTKDLDILNSSTRDPLIYHYTSKNIMIGNGNPRSNTPSIYRFPKTKIANQITGCLTPSPFAIRGA